MKTRQPLARQLCTWGLLLSAITSLGIAYLWINDLTPDDLSLGVILIAYAPSLAAFIAAIVTQSSNDLLIQLLRWRASPWLYLIAIGTAIVAVGGAYGASQLFGSGVSFDPAGIGLGIGAIIAGSIGEELGWRGFVQPRLMRRVNLFWASIAVGLLWATWHCWTVLAPHSMSNGWLLDAFLTYARLIPTALLYGWLYHVSKHSLVIVMVAHAAHNIAINALLIPTSEHSFTIAVTIGYVLIGTLLVILRPQDFFSNTPSSTIERK